MQRNIEPEALGLFSVLLQVHSDLPKNVILSYWNAGSVALSRLQLQSACQNRLPSFGGNKQLKIKEEIFKISVYTPLHEGAKCQSIGHLPAYWHSTKKFSGLGKRNFQRNVDFTISATLRSKSSSMRHPERRRSPSEDAKTAHQEHSSFEPQRCAWRARRGSSPVCAQIGHASRS